MLLQCHSLALTNRVPVYHRMDAHLYEEDCLYAQVCRIDHPQPWKLSNSLSARSKALLKGRTFINDQDFGPQPACHSFLILTNAIRKRVCVVDPNPDARERMYGYATDVACSNTYAVVC